MARKFATSRRSIDYRSIRVRSIRVYQPGRKIISSRTVIVELYQESRLRCSFGEFGSWRCPSAKVTARSRRLINATAAAIFPYLQHRKLNSAGLHRLKSSVDIRGTLYGRMKRVIADNLDRRVEKHSPWSAAWLVDAKPPQKIASRRSLVAIHLLSTDEEAGRAWQCRR